MRRAPEGAGPVFDLGPDTPFSYRCNACTRCCHHKVIQVSPYEIVRLARHLGLTTTAFIARHTVEGGTVLKRRREADGACVFLRPEGCSVHPDRPLVCRIYPLGVEVSPEGVIAYAHLAPHPETEGQYGTEGTTTSYAAAQGVPEMRAAMAPYRALHDRMADLLRALEESALNGVAALSDALSDMADGELASPLIDADATVADYCARHGLIPPRDVEATVALHVTAIAALLDAIAGDHLGDAAPG